MSPEVQGKLVAAIEQGVPVFNSGDAKGCATIYRKVLTEVLNAGQLGRSTWAQRLVTSALKTSLTELPTPAAWTLRRAMDSLLQSFMPSK